MKSFIDYYDQDGNPIEGGTLEWAAMFEDSRSRIIGRSKTLYGEMLSTVWLGLNHQYGDGPPLIFETMLFAPRDRELHRRALRQFAGEERMSEEDRAKMKADDAYVEKHYPHDQLQLRFSTKEEAAKNYNRMWWACIIPPRLRRLILYKLGENTIWS
jgi:hypothetical protein